MITVTVWCSAKRCYAKVVGPTVRGYEPACGAANTAATRLGWAIVRTTSSGTVREAYCGTHRARVAS